jgi:hypothetical protein
MLRTKENSLSQRVAFGIAEGQQGGVESSSHAQKQYDKEPYPRVKEILNHSQNTL